LNFVQESKPVDNGATRALAMALGRHLVLHNVGADSIELKVVACTNHPKELSRFEFTLEKERKVN